MKPILILGSGPAGLMVAHAMMLNQIPVVIMSKDIQSTLKGTQYLHAPIPGLTNQEPDGIIRQTFIGDEQSYRKKVYGEDMAARISTSFGKFETEHPSWDLRAVYEMLLDTFEPFITIREITAQLIKEVINSGYFWKIVSTIPKKIICKANYDSEIHHNFVSQEIMVMGRSLIQLEEGRVVYCGNGFYSWYRSSQIFGHGTTEWSTASPFPKFLLGDMIPVTKPISNGCDCWRDEVITSGRYGSWKKGILTHHAFQKGLDIADTLLKV